MESLLSIRYEWLTCLASVTTTKRLYVAQSSPSPVLLAIFNFVLEDTWFFKVYFFEIISPETKHNNFWTIVLYVLFIDCKQYNGKEEVSIMQIHNMSFLIELPSLANQECSISSCVGWRELNQVSLNDQPLTYYKS